VPSRKPSAAPTRSQRQDARVRILLWHGYLLGGTGSNVYTRALAREWARAGHDVTVLSQEPHPEAYDLGGAAATRPDVGGFLPVFVLDRYEGYDDVRRLPDCTRDELERWVDTNAAAIRELLPADLVFTNHVLLGGPVGVASGAPFAVKAHGSELEYAMRGRVDLSEWGGEALDQAQATFVGSEHVRTVVADVCGHTDRVFEVPPGVDVDLWRPEPRDIALEALVAEARRDAPNPGNADERRPDEGNAARIEVFLAGPRATVVYFGKLIEQKGVDVLLEALVGLDARVVVVGFGPERARLESLAASRGIDALFTGPLEHRHLRHLLALADTCVVPSVFPEAFGMVAAEAAAAGCPPIVARHSGLAEIAAGLEAALPPQLGALVSTPIGDVAALHGRLDGVLALPADDRAVLRATVRRVTAERWSWAAIAQRLLELSSEGHVSN
jgi:glycosyltransferase involved in cell wall biosynthesis